MGKKTSTSEELLEFTVDPAIIMHIIYNQGGNEAKALLELVMNGIDAGATSIRIDFTEQGFTCQDNGKGFVTREEIELHFQRFGTPHIEGDARYGRYRLGRGQIMAFARTKWLTQDWVMEVDIPQTGLLFSLSQTKDKFPGCHITGHWYARKEEWERNEILRELKKQLRYLDMEIEINGEKVGREQFQEQWDHEDDLAYYRIADRSGAMDIFNMGVFVKHDPSRLWGAGGVILSKKAIALNTSRTEVMRELCPVWTSISEIMEGLIEKDEKTRRKNVWTLERKERTLTKILDGHPDALRLFREAPLITLVGNSKAISLGHLLFGRKFLPMTHNIQYKYQKITICPSRSSIPDAEMIASMFPDMAVIHPTTFSEVFDCHSTGDFLRTIESAQTAVWPDGSLIGDLFHEKSYALRLRSDYAVYPRLFDAGDLAPADFSTLTQAIDRRTQILKSSDCLKGEEMRVWGAFKQHIKKFALAVRQMMNPDNEDDVEIFLGRSQTAEAWTDGGKSICLSVDLVKKMCSNPVQHAQRLFQIVEHELVHSHGGVDPSLNAEHDFNFYKRFHDTTIAAASLRQTMIRKGLKAYRYTLNMRREKLADDGWYRRTCRYRTKPKTCDREVALFYDILVMRMALIGDYDLPLNKDALRADEDIVSIIEQRIRSETPSAAAPKSADEVLTEALLIAGVKSGENAKRYEERQRAEAQDEERMQEYYESLGVEEDQSNNGLIEDWGYAREALRSVFDKLLKKRCLSWLGQEVITDPKVMALCESAVSRWHAEDLAEMRNQYGKNLTAQQMTERLSFWAEVTPTVDKIAPTDDLTLWVFDRDKYEDDLENSLCILREEFGPIPPSLSAVTREAQRIIEAEDIPGIMQRYLLRMASEKDPGSDF
ncbi:ATP-binding protein [Acetobacter malorum]|uniref:ATP-binding protein n=1 Tax=Acetobacter malorum TaxID=178901 RepID=UPI000B1EC474|nr:ATP-binding protein [Acetobacter malorum]